MQHRFHVLGRAAPPTTATKLSTMIGYATDSRDFLRLTQVLTPMPCVPYMLGLKISRACDIESARKPSEMLRDCFMLGSVTAKLLLTWCLLSILEYSDIVFAGTTSCISKMS